MYQTLRWEIKDNIGHLVLNQPPSNKMNLLFFEELTHWIQHFVPSVEAIVLYGEGRHFSYGADLYELTHNIYLEKIKNDTKQIEQWPGILLQNIKTISFFDSLPIPVIAAIRGVCLGSALELAMFCHFRLGGEGSVLGLPESTFELIPGCGGVQNLMKLAGKAKAMELLLHGNSFSAQEALDWKVVDKVLPKKTLIEQSTAFAKAIAPGYKRFRKEDYLKLLN